MPTKNSVEEAWRKAKAIDNPGGSSFPFPPNSGMGRAIRSEQAEQAGGATAAARIFPANGSGGRLQPNLRGDIELPAAETPAELRRKALIKNMARQAK